MGLKPSESLALLAVFVSVTGLKEVLEKQKLVPEFTYGTQAVDKFCTDPEVNLTAAKLWCKENLEKNSEGQPE